MNRALLIITAAHVASARAMAEAPPFGLSAADAAALFVPAGSADGTSPASHYWASGIFTTEQLAALQQLASALPWAECHQYDLDTQASFPAEWLTQNGLQPLTPDTP
jgi:hypothetical protein